MVTLGLADFLACDMQGPPGTTRSLYQKKSFHNLSYCAVYNLTERSFVAPFENLTLLGLMMGREGGREMEELGMARQSKRDYLRSIHKRYRQARRREKSAMLEEFARICGYNRKYAIWLLKRPLPQPKAHRRRGKRSVTYSQAAIATLAKVWEASGYLCSQRLKAALPQWLAWVKKHFDISKELEKQLLGISPRQMDRRLFPHKRAAKRRLYGTTRPGSLLKHMIPIKTDHWDVTLPGYLEVDLVSHSGRSGAGEFIYTLDC